MADALSLLGPDDPAWDGWLRGAPHDFHHRAGYHALAERMGEGRAVMAIFGTPGRYMAWPYLVREVEGDLYDATSVYGYTGPTGQGLGDEGFRDAAWSALRAAWAEQRLVTLFTRFHPLLGNERHCEGLHGEQTPPGGETLVFGRSVSIDLSLGPDERRARYPQPLRQDVKRSERSGLVVELDRDWSCFGQFVSFYRATMERNDAADRYLFSDAYFDDLRASLGETGHLAVARQGGDIAAALLFMVCEGIATAHLTGINPDFARASPLKCLLDRSCDIARELGAERLHLGAGRGGAEDSLFAFKSRFSPLRHDFVAGRWILDRDAHARLLRARGAPQTGPEGIFFPAYRAPALEPVA